jgi:cyclic beta-1,2-glucan synthetase
MRLRSPRGLAEHIRKAREAALGIPREALSPVGVWAEDHALFLLEEADALERALKRAPRLPGEGGVPRLLRWARAVCEENQGEISAPLIVRVIQREAGEEEITEEELSLLPRALACALFERMGEMLENCIQEKERRTRVLAWAKRFSAGEWDELPRDGALLSALLRALSEKENPAGLRRAYEALRASGLRWEEIVRQEQDRQTAQGLDAGRLISSLRGLSRLPFDAVRERLSPVIRILRADPTFPRMDRESRDLYVGRACLIAKRLRISQSAAARAAVALAEGKSGPEGEAGYYLLERPDLIAVSLHRRKRPSFALRHRTGLFLAPLYGGAAACFIVSALAGAPWYLWGPMALCVSEILRRLEYAVLRRLLPARMLPRLRVKCLTQATRTLVVIPALLTSRKEALRLVRQLSVLRLAADDPCLDFMLLADFADSPAETEAADEDILLAARLAVEELNRQQGGGFFYLHRARRWDMGQRAYTGRERKRGALESLNQLLTEGTCADSFLYMSHGGDELRHRYAYVITLDADTFLPPGAARQLVGAMLHPLQRGRVGVIQPRMETAPDRVRTHAQKWLGGMGGADPYHLSVQDVYQDVFGHGSFVGKGIYEPEAWTHHLAGRLPRGRLLSHDLIEGEIVGSALSDDVVLFDGHPARLSGWQKRLHRWTRGDWQLLPFLADARLSLLSRHKIWDNLRRSLLPAAQCLLLIAGAFFNSPLLTLLALPWPLRGMDKRLFLLPCKAYTTLDAAARALYRQFVSRRNLLSWITAAQAEENGALPLPCMLAQVGAGTVLTVLSLLPGGLWPLSLIGLIWVSAPLWVPLLDAPAALSRPMTRSDAEDARKLARRTWQFFEDSVSADTLFLPPDNVQEEPKKGPALRTSPTNMGLYLLSCCAAHTLGFLPIGELSQKLNDTLNTLEKLPTWHGHFYNWYSLRTGEPLGPRFVSTVDSGNCAACLLCCAQLLRMWLQKLPEEGRSLPARLDALAHGMDFSALYDEKAHLFYVGWEAEARRFTPSHYDCLASEARLTSFVAIMLNQTERKHWLYLNRAVTKAGLGAALLSWGGTMFEYLLPQLFLPLLPGTLIGESCLNAVRAQMAADPSRPFGISESGYYAFDPEMNYQYRAFGLPLLARSGETAGKTVAPYASMLAFPLFPRAAAKNMRRMQRLGWEDGHGFFEAADWAENHRPRVVQSHMAHHQGMILCALCNALENGALTRAFMALPAAKANACLLWERAPRHARRRIALPPPRQEETAAAFPPPRPARSGLPPETQLLSGGGARWLLTSLGQGFLAAGNMMITRFDAQAGSQTGPQFYLRDRQSGAFLRPAVSGGAFFGEGAALFRVSWQGMRVALRCCVDPLTGMAVAALHAENLTNTEKEIEAISFLEIAQGPREADEAHPNFRDLSVRVSPWGSRGLLSGRLPRDEKDRMPLIAHAVTGDVFALRRQGDRALFLGREGTYAAPEQLTLPDDACIFRTGDVIAPCLSLRARMRVPAEGKAAVYFLTLTANSEEALASVPLTVSRAQAAFALAKTQEKTVFRFLGLGPESPALYRDMLGAALFYDQPHQQALPSARSDALWRVGVSGAAPVVLILLTQGSDRALISHALRFHAWLRMGGVNTDLIFFCPPENGYFRPVQDQARALAAATPERELWGQPGGLHWAEGDETLARALESLARLTLRSGQSLKAQLSALRMPLPADWTQTLTLPEPLIPPGLQEVNGFGGYLRDGGYCVAAPAPGPWHQLLCSPLFGMLVCETGILHAWAGNSRLGRITRLCPDPHRGVPSEEILLQNEDGQTFPLTRCAAVYEPGAASYRCMAGDVTAETAVFVHEEKSLSVRSVTLRSEKECTLRLYWLLRFALGEHPERTRCRAEEGFAFAFSGDFRGLAWAGMEQAACQSLCAASCFGCTGENVPPPLSFPAFGIGSAGLLQRTLTLRPREPVRLTLALGWAPDEGTARLDWEALLAQGPSQAERDTRAAWAQRLSRLQLFSFHRPLDSMMNLWLPYQVYAARLFGRMGPYQTGGAFGFRDQLQDCLALLHTDPAFVRAHILLCAAHQFRSGDVQHWWHPPRRGVRTRVSDDKLFLPFLTARYVSVTGDESVLTEEAPYLVSAPLSETEEDRYEEPEVSPEREPLLAHCLRAIDSVSFGAHGLPLMGGGDWNDGMNRVGGKTGESVWLGFFLALTLKEFTPLCPPEIREKYRLLRQSVLDKTESAWTGKWYLRAWKHGGAPLGGPDTDPPRIDLITQCFAVLAGAPRNKARTALLHAVEKLYDRKTGLVKLLDPPFAPAEDAGYIGGYLPGVRENGGQYTHAVPWLILALCRLNEFDLAWEIALAALPAAHSDTAEKAMVYKIEPYVLAGDVYAGENTGRGGWSWYTGSAAWMYWAVLTGLMGFEKRGDKARLLPRTGPEGEEYTLVLRFGSANYHFTAARDTLFPTLDGARLEDGWAPLLSDGRTHEARFPMRTGI